VNRLRKWWKPGLFVLLALIAVQAGVSLLSRTASAKAFLTRQLELSFGRAVEVREYSVTLFPRPGLDAYAISVGEDPAFGREYFLRADRLSASLRWTGLLRGRFELGTLQLERPSLILVRNSEGRWNLERWLPATNSEMTSGTVAAASGSQATPAHLLQKIDITDGRANFKLGEDKTTFAFIQVEGSVEQSAPGRWHLNLKAEPWRSGVPLQLAGTVRISGDVAGTSARLQPARLRMTWQKSSLADVFRLFGGQDFGVRGVFAAEATAESGGPSVAGAKNAAPGDWLFAVQARASGIHRWDLTERSDNPRVGLRLNGRWNPGAGSVNADELVVESPRSNLRGTASLNSIANTGAEVRVDSAGILAADLLDWYRAFKPDVSEEIRVSQYFTGAATFRGWPPEFSDAAFSSPGGTLRVPGFAAPLEVKALRGGTQKRKLVIGPFSVIVPVGKTVAVPGKLQNISNREIFSNIPGGVVNLTLVHDLDAGTGGIRIEGQTARVEDVLGMASAFGRRLQNGWELSGRVSADLHWDWIVGKAPSWNGRADVSQGTLQVAGLNQPVQLESVRAEWRAAGRKFTLGRVAAFGAAWSGFVEQPTLLPSEFGESEIPAWTFQLLADHLDASELDRWVGPRARPGWLQRLLPAGLGGAAPEPPSALLRRIRAEGELAVDELTIEKIKLRQFHAKAKLDSLKLSMKGVDAKWSGGDVSGAADAVFSARPSYQISALFDRISLAQTPWLAQVADHLTGTASGFVQLHTAGIGREALFGNLAGRGDLQLAKIELRGWDVAGTMALGEWKPGTSRWTAGTGTFHLSGGGFDVNSLRLVSTSDEFLLKGSVSFSEETDLTAESHATGRGVRTESTIRFMQISGPINGPRVSLEKATAQQPGD
jgi:hypothetical protein